MSLPTPTFFRTFQNTESEALRGLEQQLSSLVENIMIAEAKLSAAEKAEFDSKYYAPAKPAIEGQRREKARIQGLIR